MQPTDLVILIILGGAALASALDLVAGGMRALPLILARLGLLALAGVGAARPQGDSPLPGWALCLTGPVAGAESGSAFVALAYLVMGLAVVENRLRDPISPRPRKALWLVLGLAALGAPLLVRREGPGLAAETAIAALAFLLVYAVCRERGLGQILRAELPVLDLSRAKLSPRECDVLELHRRNLSTKEIASTLSLSPSTVRKVLSDVYHKLRVGNAAELTALTVSHRLEEGAAGRARKGKRPQ